MHSLQLVRVSHQHDSGNDCSREIGDRHTVPYAVDIPYYRQECQKWQEDEQLSRQGEEDADLYLSDALEEIGDDHLESDDREADHHHSDGLDAQVYQRLVCSKQSCALIG